MKILLMIVPLILGVVVTLLVIGEQPTLLNSIPFYKQSVAKTTSQTPQIKLPSGLVQITNCIPFEGEHWVDPKNLPNGPFFVTYNGQVTAVEYMFIPDQLPGKEAAYMTQDQFVQLMQSKHLSLADFVKTVNTTHNLFDYPYKTLDIHWTAPHAGITVPHIDMHFYLVDENTLAKVCPNAQAQDIYSPQMLQTFHDLNIPFPGATSSATAK